MQKTITNKLVSTETGYSKNQVNYMKNNYFRSLELIKKGLLYEKIKNTITENGEEEQLVKAIKSGAYEEKHIRKPRIKKQ